MKSQHTNELRITAAMCFLASNTCHAFSILSSHHVQLSPLSSSKISLNLRAPPGSGYAADEDEISHYPDTYDPMMEYPGTMRPGSTPENQPYTSLPIQESDPDPVPWPHFQEIEWHHNWGSPHEHPIPMEEFIDMNGRWATAEMEAEMRAGARRGVRERRELEEAQKAASFILDDDEEEDEEEEDPIKIGLGQGVEAFIGKDIADGAATTVEGGSVVEENVDEDDDDDDDDDDDTDDFLLDLGLDGEDSDADADDDDDDEEDNDDADDDDEPAFVTQDVGGAGDILQALETMIDAEESGDGGSDEEEIQLNFDDLDLNFDDEGDEGEAATSTDAKAADAGNSEDFVLMDDEDVSMGREEDMIPLDDMIGNEDMGDDDNFDDGGFDYD